MVRASSGFFLVFITQERFSLKWTRPNVLIVATLFSCFVIIIIIIIIIRVDVTMINEQRIQKNE